MGWPYQQKPPMGWPLDYGSGLVPDAGFWPMLEGSGTKVFDLSGNGNDGTAGGTITQISWQSGPYGSVIDFVGNAVAYFALKNEITFLATDAWTITFSAQTDGDGSEAMPLGKHNTLDDYIWIREGNYFRIRSSDADNTDFTSVQSFTSWATYSLVAKGDGNLHLYVNGVFKETVAGSSAFVLGHLGSAYTGSNFLLDGRLSHVFAHNRALSSSDVALLYQYPFWMFKDPAEVALLGGYQAVVGAAGIMTTNTGYWGPTF